MKIINLQNSSLNHGRLITKYALLWTDFLFGLRLEGYKSKWHQSKTVAEEVSQTYYLSRWTKTNNGLQEHIKFIGLQLVWCIVLVWGILMLYNLIALITGLSHEPGNVYVTVFVMVLNYLTFVFMFSSFYFLLKASRVDKHIRSIILSKEGYADTPKRVLVTSSGFLSFLVSGMIIATLINYTMILMDYTQPLLPQLVG